VFLADTETLAIENVSECRW